MALALPLPVAEAARAGMGCGGRTGGVGTSAGIVSEREWREATGGEPRPPSERDESERRTLSVRPPGVPPRALARAIPAVAGVAPYFGLQKPSVPGDGVQQKKKGVPACSPNHRGPMFL